jgi:membrane protease YdiL (CAAX protease family)
LEIHALDALLGALLLALVLLSAVALWLIHIDRLPRPFRFARPPRREPPLWQARDILLLVILYFLLLLGLGPLLHGLRERELLDEGGVLALGQLASGIVLTAYILVVVRRGYGQPLSAIGFAGSPLRNLVPVLALFVLFFPVLVLFSHLWTAALERAGFEKMEQLPVNLVREAIEREDVRGLTLLVLGAVLVAAVYEEILFRGFVFGMLRPRLGFALAAAASSFIFALLHPPLFAMGPIFLVGLVLCYVYERTGSLYYAMFYHALFNAVNLVGLALQKPG